MIDRGISRYKYPFPRGKGKGDRFIFDSFQPSNVFHQVHIFAQDKPSEGSIKQYSVIRGQCFAGSHQYLAQGKEPAFPGLLIATIFPYKQILLIYFSRGIKIPALGCTERRPAPTFKVSIEIMFTALCHSEPFDTFSRSLY
jgi:hypothetical protein